ncbi:FimV/HubP family polar landmark protein, partial [Pseudoalteromonas sp. BSi20495]|uniref:FimV/HubP family polar landmark protein n=1 Tax=Pseudoalteromonas sp. BSi20495 TaxID=386429 RepID=UPI000519BF2C
NVEDNDELSVNLDNDSAQLDTDLAIDAEPQNNSNAEIDEALNVEDSDELPINSDAGISVNESETPELEETQPTEPDDELLLDIDSAQLDTDLAIDAEPQNNSSAEIDETLNVEDDADSDELSVNLDDEPTHSLPSQTEQDLMNALSAENDLNSLDDDFDDELLLDNDFAELDTDSDELSVNLDDAITVNEPETPKLEETQTLEPDDELLLDNDSAQLDTDLAIDAEPQNNSSAEIDEALNVEDAADSDELSVNLDDEPTHSLPSQTEQDLMNALSAGNDLNNLDDDFDDELLLDNDFTELDAELESTAGSETMISENPDEALSNELAGEQTNADREAEITRTELFNSSDIASDDELDDEFMAELTETDFDSLLNELAEPEELSVEDSSEFDVDFDSLLKEDLGVDEALVVEEPLVQSNNVEQLDNDEFVDIDSLLEESDDAEIEHEPYNDVNMDVGLSEFDALLAGDNPTDVDAESGGYSAKLDLARAYIEIDDFDSALKVIEDVINKGPEEVQEEALSLKAKLK